jgi:hypothetical protein
MNEEEEKSPLEDPRVRRNRVARERYAARSKEQRVADASRWEAQKARSAQRVANVNRWKLKGHVVPSVN